MSLDWQGSFEVGYASKSSGGWAVSLLTSWVEIAQNVEIDINLEKVARPSEDAKARGNYMPGLPNGRR